MVDCDLNEVTREVRPAAQQDVEDLLSNKWAPAQRPKKGLGRSVSRDEVVSPDIGVSRERIEASAYKHK